MTHTRTYTLPELAAKRMIDGESVEVRITGSNQLSLPDAGKWYRGLITAVRIHNDVFYMEMWLENESLAVVPLTGGTEVRW